MPDRIDDDAEKKSRAELRFLTEKDDEDIHQDIECEDQDVILYPPVGGDRPSHPVNKKTEAVDKEDREDDPKRVKPSLR